jgi:hypothetical protein
MYVPVWINKLRNRQDPAAADDNAPSEPAAQHWLHTLISHRRHPEGNVESIAAQIVAFLGNAEPVSWERPHSFVLDTAYAQTMGITGKVSSVIAIDSQNTKNYYEDLKSFTRSYPPLCKAMGGNVNENDVIPIVHYAIMQVAEKAASRKHAPLNFSPMGLKPLYDEIAGQITANVQQALDAAKEKDFKPQIQQFMLADAALQPEVPLTKQVKEQRVELITRYLQSEQREGENGLKNFNDAITKRRLQALKYPEHNMYDRIHEKVAEDIRGMEDKRLAEAYHSQIGTIVNAGVEQYVVHNASDAQWDRILQMRPQELSDEITATVQQRMAEHHQAAPPGNIQRSR